MKQVISTGYIPRPLQAKTHSLLKRFNAIVCHRRWGKSHFAVNEMIDKAFRNPLKNPQYAYVGPNYAQVKRVIWDILKNYLKDIPGVETNEAELRLEIPRPHMGDKIKFMLLSAENPASLKGIYLDGAILDEFAECVPTVWSEAIRPTLSDRKGWAIFIGTPKGQNHFYDVYMTAKKDPGHWYHVIYKASETGIIDDEELASLRASMAPEEYEQEMECSFSAAIVGAYYGKYMEDLEKKNRITDVPYDPAVPVNTYWDLGIGDTTVIWFIQQVGPSFHAIDYYEMSGMGLEHYAKIIKEKNYFYGEHVVPHDAAARSLDSGRSRQETLRSLGIRTRVAEKQKIEDGINAARVVLPRMWFDAIKCERGIAALKNYQQKYDHKNKIFSDAPLHDWASNGADAFRTFAISVRDQSKRQNPDALQRQAVSDFDIFERGA